MEEPQLVGLLEVALIEGTGLMDTVACAVEKQFVPAKLPVTVYTVVVPGAAFTDGPVVLFNPVAGLQL